MILNCLHLGRKKGLLGKTVNEAVNKRNAPVSNLLARVFFRRVFFAHMQTKFWLFLWSLALVWGGILLISHLLVLRFLIELPFSRLASFIFVWKEKPVINCIYSTQKVTAMFLFKTIRRDLREYELAFRFLSILNFPISIQSLHKNRLDFHVHSYKAPTSEWKMLFMKIYENLWKNFTCDRESVGRKSSKYSIKLIWFLRWISMKNHLTQSWQQKQLKMCIRYVTCDGYFC